MNERRYAWAGFAAITAAALILPVIALGVTVDVVSHKHAKVGSVLLLPYLVIGVFQTCCALYAFGRFKTFLNERLDFHQTDLLLDAVCNVLLGLILLRPGQAVVQPEFV